MSELFFKFKGSRNYVQGPDIFKAVSQEFEESSIGWIKQLRFNFLLKSNAKLLMGNDLLNYDKNILSAHGIVIVDAEKDLPFALLPLDNAIIHERHEYSEHEIINKLSHCSEDKSIKLATQTPFSLIEEAVAAVKELHNRLTFPPSGKKWLFTGINLSRKLPAGRSGATLQVIRRQIIANRFSRNELYIGSQCFGAIDFTMGNS